MEHGIREINSNEFSAQLLSDRSFPLAGQWELTCRCNLKCVMCYTDPFNTPEMIRKELGFEEIVRILDELREAGCMELTLTGGEPLSRMDFTEIHRAAHQRGFLLQVFTNGTLITKQIADLWVERPPVRVEISMHGSTGATFDRVTQKQGSFARCMSGIRLVLERKIPLVLKTVGLRINRDEILEIKRVAESLGSGVAWRFGKYMIDDLAKSGAPFAFQLSEEELESVMQQEPKLLEERASWGTSSESGPRKCGGGHRKFHIDAYGQMQLCGGNRRASYDLRKGSFQEGFYNALPTFPCPNRSANAKEELARRSGPITHAEEGPTSPPGNCQKVSA